MIPSSDMSIVTQNKLSNEAPCLSPSTPLGILTPQTHLMWHFVTTTSTTLALLNGTRWTWETEVPLQAETNPFLLHGLMAVSAMHMGMLLPQQSKEYRSMACQTYRTALVMFRSAVRDINKDNCIAVLAFSLLVSVFQFGILRVPAG
jgi:hypothetical protein